VLVLHDMLGLHPAQPPRFVRDFMDGATGIGHAVRRYVEAVKDGSYPDPERHAY
jgi:3-methyl-2-oxobutanoate hydroxymethyltransferase